MLNLLVIVPVLVGLGLLYPLLVYTYDAKDLRRFPAPSFAGISNLWAARAVRHGNRSLQVHEAHQKLGAIVRIQPNHISFNKPEAVQDIYGFSQHLLKDEFYNTFTGNSFASIVGTRSRSEHARKRKYVSNAFAQKNIVDMEPVVQQQISVLLDKLDSCCPSDSNPSGTSINMRTWLNYFTFDVITRATFGASVDFLRNGSDATVAETRQGQCYGVHAITSFHSNSAYDTFLAHWPAVLHWTKRLSSWHTGHKGGVDFNAVCVHQVRNRQRNGKPQGYTDFFHHLLVDRSGKEVGLDLDELEKEAGVLINAGSDTTATAMTHCLYFIVKHPAVMQKLRDELDDVLGSQNRAASYAQVKDMKYLRACVDEAMRLRPPTSMGLPRVTPPEGVNIAGVRIAGNTTVSVPTYTLHRNAELFSEPELFRPERWLDEVEGPICRQFVMPFSTGPRACTGRNLSYLEQTVLMATLVHQYNWKFETSDLELGTVERFNANPADMLMNVEQRFKDNATPLVA